MFRRCLFAGLFLLLVRVICAGPAQAQTQTQPQLQPQALAQELPTDSLHLTLRQAEEQFLRTNLRVIIQRYNIDNATAQVLTARLFINPDFVFSNGVTASGLMEGQPDATCEKTYSLAQVLRTAGKRNKNIRVATIGVQLAQYQFFDLLRTLKYVLRYDFYSIHYQQQSSKVYKLEISSLTNILKAFREQYAKGNIAEKEVIRIQSQLYNLQNEYNNLQIGIDTTANEFKQLIRAPRTGNVVPEVATLNGKQDLQASGVPYRQLLDSAFVNRYDLKYATANTEYARANLALQRANAVPDVIASVQYDKLGAYGTEYVGAGLEFNLPVFNRNQGNIKLAKIAIEQTRTNLQNLQERIESDFITSYKGAVRIEGLYNGLDPNFRRDFTHLITEVSRNYRARNIGLLEFLDFYESYKNNTLQLNNLELARITSLEQLNFVTGTRFFNKQ